MQTPGSIQRKSIINSQRSVRKSLLTQLMILAVAVLLIGQIVVAWFALTGFERELEPQLNQKANTVGISVTERLSYAINTLEIDSSELVGVSAYFDEVLASNPDIAFLAYGNAQGDLLFVSGVSRAMAESIMIPTGVEANPEDNFQAESEGYLSGHFAVQEIDGTISHLHVGVLSEHIRNQLSEIFLELVIVIAVSWLVTFELLSFFVNGHVFEPINCIRTAINRGAAGKFTSRLLAKSQDEMGILTTAYNRMLNRIHNQYSNFAFEVRELKNAQIDDNIARRISHIHQKISDRYSLEGSSVIKTVSPGQIRVPLFLFIFSEELSRSFLPLFIAQTLPSEIGSAPEYLIGLPITLFMLAVMIATPIGGGMVDRYGVRNVFLSGILISTCGYIATFFTQGYTDLVAYRLLTGIGYGLVFISSEGWVTSQAQAHNRSSSTGVFVSAVFTGIICGPSIGGIVADRVGYEATFLFSAILAITSGLVIYQVFRQHEITAENRVKPDSFDVKNWLILLRDARFLAVLAFSAVPGKMMVAGFIAYLVPLYLSELGHSASSIGRILMLYGLATLCLVSVVAKYADRSRKYGRVVAVGGTVAGLGCLASYFGESYGASNMVIVAILALGIGHGLTLTSQNSIIQLVAVRYSNTIGSASVIGAYRLIERLGMLIGPLIAVVLVSSLGFQGAIIAFGAILLGLITLFVAVMKSQDRPQIKPRQPVPEANA